MIRKLFCTHLYKRTGKARYVDFEYCEWGCDKCGKRIWRLFDWLPINYIGDK